MNKEINQKVKICAIEQKKLLNGTADNSHVFIGMGFIGLIAVLNLFLIF